MLFAQIADFEGYYAVTTATADLSAVSWAAEGYSLGVYAVFAADSYATTHLCAPPGLIPEGEGGGEGEGERGRGRGREGGRERDATCSCCRVYPPSGLVLPEELPSSLPRFRLGVPFWGRVVAMQWSPIRH